MALPSSMRLKGIRCFKHLNSSGKRFYSSSMVLKVASAKPKLLRFSKKVLTKNSVRCAVTISSKVSKKAVIRNKLRRLLHDHLRQRLENLAYLSNEWAQISLKPNSSNKEGKLLIQECDHLLFKSGLIK